MAQIVPTVRQETAGRPRVAPLRIRFDIVECPIGEVSLRPSQFGFLLALFLLNLSLWGQQAPMSTLQSEATVGVANQSAATPPPSTNDPQAVSVVTQALIAAGGTNSINTINDYSATGNITHHLTKDIQGSVSVRAHGLEQFRLDANLPTGLLSQIIDGELTVKTEDGQISKPYYDAPFSPIRLVLPQVFLSNALNSPVVGDSSGYVLSYKGVVQVDGRSAQDVQVQLVIPAEGDPNGSFRTSHTVDFLIDSLTLQVVMTKELLTVVSERVVRYSDYRNVNGVAVPFAISESTDGYLQSWLLQLDEVTFNVGLLDSDFKF